MPKYGNWEAYYWHWAHFRVLHLLKGKHELQSDSRSTNWISHLADMPSLH